MRVILAASLTAVALTAAAQPTLESPAPRLADLPLATEWDEVFAVNVRAIGFEGLKARGAAS